ncbi:unnamed protein product [Prorocentrum cordatum]|uniref:Uncharacterized protein n=1 Tax=Prorocentrum cordatum TaxID=2364126 RepID=A0ABN9XQE6_9DINO|nr:unnamed protein product [Polarella glacialis]
MQAVTKSRQGAPSRTSLNDMLENAGPCNQCEYVGLLSHGLELTASDLNQQLLTLLNMVKCITKNGLRVTFPGEAAAFRLQADKTMAAVFSEMKGKSIGPETFWEKYRDECSWILPVEAVDGLMAGKGSWDNHSEDIDAVTGTSELGMRMFQGAARSNVFNRVKKACNSRIAELLDGREVTKATVQECKAKIMADVQAMSIPDLPNRVIVLSYLGDDAKVKVDSALGEVKIRLNTCIKMRAHARQGKETGKSAARILTPLFCELELADKVGPNYKGVAADLLKPFNSARKSANGSVTADRHADGDAVVTQLDDQEDVLSLIDDTIIVEIAWFRLMAGAGVQGKLKKDILRILPDRAGVHQPRAIADQVAQLTVQCRYRFGSTDAKSIVNIVGEWLNAISNRRAPSLAAAKEGEWLWTVRERLGYLCHCEEDRGAHLVRTPRC